MSRRDRQDRRHRARRVEALRAGIGVAHLLASRGSTGRVAVFGRVLGVRQLVQAGLLTRAGSPEAHVLGAAVDATHGVTMVPLIALDPRARGFAVRQLVVAVLLTALEVGLVGTGRGRTGRR
ncbi:hypothetical protein DEJ23_12620 [Curtobacterium sp. MCSS17_008]|uniref:hypothetical protein n=1 Tax=Curtobacterium sp. MCSS17_008 TaxID=2175647 RepID=UPI000DAA2694|nr:hypothetical protein [Curtobacterium sp. MCSS17_008]PZF55325.1 hypothetical protein DEJ23_12620 [Curtobacterium sp. MCSS17_008]